MQYIKKFLSILLVFMMLFCFISTSYFTVPVKAADPVTVYDYAKMVSDLIGANQDVPIEILREAFYKTLCFNSGYILTSETVLQGELIRKGWASILNKKYSNQNKNENNLSQSDINEIATDFINNITLNNDESIISNFLSITQNTK